MTLEKIDWIINYLPKKDARLDDFKEFFVIQNKKERVKVKQIDETTYEYILKDCKFTLNLEKLEKPKSHFKVKNISCLSL